MAAAPMILMGSGAGMGAAGASMQGAGALAAANYNAAVKNNQANAAVLQAAEDERRQRVQGKMALGGIRASIGANGIQTEGSALDVLEASAANSELDALSIRHQGQMKKWAYEAGANSDLLEGTNKKTAADISAVSMLIKGGGQMAAASGGGS